MRDGVMTPLVWFNVVIRGFENKQLLLSYGKAASFIPEKNLGQLCW